MALRSIRRFCLPLLALAAVLTSKPLEAQTEGFAINRFEPSERGSDWFTTESLDMRGHLRPAIGIVGDWAYKPLVLYDANGDEQAAIVKHQIFAHLGGALTLYDRFRLGVNLPLGRLPDGRSRHAVQQLL